MSGIWGQDQQLKAQHLTSPHEPLTGLRKQKDVVTDCTRTIFSPPYLFDDLTKKNLTVVGMSEHEMGGVHRVLVRRPEEMRPLGRLRHTWENSIKMDHHEEG
jgi:hypothetical protein